MITGTLLALFLAAVLMLMSGIKNYNVNLMFAACLVFSAFVGFGLAVIMLNIVGSS